MPEHTDLTERPIGDWDASLTPVVDDMRGRPLNVHKLLANHPDLLGAWWSLRMHIVSGGSLEQRQAELIILRTAAHTAQWYEWASHVARGLACGLSMDEIERVIEGPDASGWSSVDALLLGAVDELQSTHSLSNAMRRSLAEHFDSKQLLDLIALHSTYVFLGAILNTWETDLDEQVVQQLPEAMTRRRFTELLGE